MGFLSGWLVAFLGWLCLPVNWLSPTARQHGTSCAGRCGAITEELPYICPLKRGVACLALSELEEVQIKTASEQHPCSYASREARKGPREGWQPPWSSELHTFFIGTVHFKFMPGRGLLQTIVLVAFKHRESL